MNAAYAYFGSTHKMYDRMHVQACHQNCSSSCMGVGAGVCVYIYTYNMYIYIHTYLHVGYFFTGVRPATSKYIRACSQNDKGS